MPKRKRDVETHTGKNPKTKQQKQTTKRVRKRNEKNEEPDEQDHAEINETYDKKIETESDVSSEEEEDEEEEKESNEQESDSNEGDNEETIDSENKQETPQPDHQKADSGSESTESENSETEGDSTDSEHSCSESETESETERDQEEPEATKQNATEREQEQNKDHNDAKSSKPKPARDKPHRRKPMSLSAFKTTYNPFHLLDPIKRKEIWNNLMLMMERRGYTWVRDRPDPMETEQLTVSKIKGYLGMFHMHAVHPVREPVYVVLFSKSGEPALKQLVYPSRHIIVLTDATTGKARNAMKHAINQKNYGLTLVKKGADEIKDTKQPILYPMQDVYMESHTSDVFSTDIIKHRYLETYEITLATLEEREQVAKVFEADIMKYPLIPDSDPIVRYFGYRPGDVLKEKNLSTTAGITYSFRTVVPTKTK